MYENKIPNIPMYTGRMQSVECFNGESIEEKVERVVNNGEPITDGAPIIYTEKKDGVMPEYNIRTDRFDVAMDAVDKMNKARIAQREKIAKDAMKDVPDKLEGGSPSEN